MSRAASPSMTRRLRCAIYTRKSSEEGLDQTFNSLDAQREACEAYVLSQAGEGWSSSKRAYDDGGFSGGSMDRPGLKALLDDIDRKLVDVVVVYKVDRLTRSLADFAKIVEVFDARGVSFVSVTQAFNTTSSMGRLTLNVLLSFAQFEREVTGERIRDKIAASKAKGMWMGGNLPLGYDAKDRMLVINPEEAVQVRNIFDRYLQLGSVDDLKADLDALGCTSKVWTTRKGTTRGGRPLGRGALFHLLRNQTYIGRIPHKEATYPGQHQAIVDEAVFAAVQARLTEGAALRTGRSTGVATAPLRGLIFDAHGAPMTPTFTYAKHKRVYRYYVSKGRAHSRGAEGQQDVRRIAAEPFEAMVRDRLERVLGAPASSPWRQLQPHIARVEVMSGLVRIVVSGLEDDTDRLRARLDNADRLTPCDEADDLAAIEIAVRPVFRGGRTWLVAPTGRAADRPAHIDPALLKALRFAHRWQTKLDASPLTSMEGLQTAKAAADSYVRRLTPLAFLAPDIQQAIINGSQPVGLTLQQLINTKIPVAWDDQRQMLGFGTAAQNPS